MLTVKDLRSNHPLYLSWFWFRKKKADGSANMCDLWINNRNLFLQWAIDNGWINGARLIRSNMFEPHSPSNSFLLPATKDLMDDDLLKTFKKNIPKKYKHEIKKMLRDNVEQVMISHRYKVALSALSALQKSTRCS